jgi:hypothetical protein
MDSKHLHVSPKVVLIIIISKIIINVGPNFGILYYKSNFGYANFACDVLNGGGNLLNHMTIQDGAMLGSFHNIWNKCGKIKLHCGTSLVSL